MAEFIAEISSNHNGDLARCRRLIEAAARVGCTGVKFQLFRIDKLFAPQILRVSAEHRRRRRWELPLRFLPELSACARDLGLRFGCTPFDLDAVDQLRPHVDFLKIASYELPWLDLVHACAHTELPLLISTGMADAAEAWAAVEAALESGCTDLTMLHCVSRYPVPELDCNLAAIGTLRELMDRNFAPDYPEASFRAGWSDHSVSSGIIARAVHHWAADVVEFHFDLEGQGEEFGGGHCWLPDQIERVILGGFQPVSPSCDGSGRIAPVEADRDERTWRADPSDGLRPTLAVRRTWPDQQSDARRAGPDVIFVADGCGLGHVARCLALAEVLRDEHDADVIFFLRNDPAQAALLDRHGFNHDTFIDHAGLCDAIGFLANLSRERGPTVCVLDADHPVEGLTRRLRDAGRLVVALDQPACADAHLVVVPSFGWEAPHDQQGMVGGTDYLLIRDDVLACRGPAESAPPELAPPRVVVSFGGLDPHDLTARLAVALHEIAPEAQMQIVLGRGVEHGKLKAEVLARRFREFEVIHTGDPLEPLLAGAALLITAMGVSVGEALALGTPAAILSNYEHDAPTVARLAATGAVVDLGWQGAVDQHELLQNLRPILEAPRLAGMRAAAVGLVDGRGTRRTAEHVMRLVATGGDRVC